MAAAVLPVTREAPAAHPFADERALVLGHRLADLEQEVLVRGVAEGLIEELDCRAGAPEVLEQHHLVDVVAGEAARTR